MEYSTYLCKQCKKIFKGKGNNKKVKCPHCKDILLFDMDIDFEEWLKFDKSKRESLINDFMFTYAFLSPKSFESILKRIRNKSDEDLFKIIGESKEEIEQAYFDIDEVQAGNMLVLFGTIIAFYGLKDIQLKKELVLKAADIDGIVTDEELYNFLDNYSTKYLSIIDNAAHYFDTDTVAIPIFNYLLAAACIGVVNEQAISSIKKVFYSWFAPYDESKFDASNNPEKEIPESNDGASTEEKTSQENALFMYVCRKCRKVFKVKGSNKKVKCKSCSSLLDFTNIASETWDTYDKTKKSAVIKGEPIKEPDTQNDEEYIFEYETIKDNSSIIKGHLIATDENGNEYQEDLFGNRLDEIGKYECVVNFYSELAPIVGIGQFLENMRENGKKLCWKSIKNRIEVINIPVTIIVTMSSDNVVEIKRYGRLVSGLGRVISERKISLDELIETDLEKIDLMKEYDLAAAAVSISFLPELKEKGVIDNINEYSNRGAGVFLEIKDNNLKIRVVMRNTRPDLECVDPLFGKIKARPYRDEGIIESILSKMSLDEIVEYAEDGNPESMKKVADAYFNGDGVSIDFAKATYWYEKLAQTEDPTGQYNTGLMYAKGCGVSRDIKRAVFWMKKAADGGDEDAAEMIDSFVSLRDNYDKANRGDAQAQADLAEAFMKLGGSVEQMGEGDDYKESFKWAEKSASQGNGKGIWILALAYAHGRGTNVDMKKAHELYKQGAELGNPSCQHNLGCQYLSGQFVEKDDNKGFEWIRKAAVQGHGLAMRDLGKCYQFATGTPGNMKTAIQWYEKALKVIDDPELAQKVEHFKTLESIDPDFEKDYPQRPNDPNMNDKVKMAANNSKAISEPKVDADKEIRAKIRSVKNERAKADKQFEEGIDILRDPGVSMDYDNYIDVATRLFRMSDSISRALYNSLQNLVQELDGFCRNMLKHKPSSAVIQDICDLIMDMNESAEIENNLNIEFEGMKINNPCQRKFEPSARCKEIERFWRNESSKSKSASALNTENLGTNNIEKTASRSSFFDTVSHKPASDLNDKDREILDALKASSAPMTINEIYKALGEKDSFQLLTAKLKQLKDKEIVTSHMEGRIMKWSIK